MIIVKSISLNPGTMQADTFLFADTKDEMDDAVASDFIGFPVGYELEMGSKVMTSKGEVAFLKSDGSWNWGDS